ncbi:uncharacterized protein LOC141906275 [Tubulanus polymorphus]|uniref:uncharacterized protein LOC141906275 n=1 Tax=Tubulanus polymorphus TaxID=672921 RepID=UPI003DA44DAD
MDNENLCSFTVSKTHLAPNKHPLTIPKLELQGAVLAVHLAETLMAEISEIKAVTYWIDSQTVIRYIGNEKKRFKTFVANRIAEIREVSSVNQWKFVSTDCNPADDCTRGLSGSQLEISHRWFDGPDFLKQSENSWPSQPQVGCISDADENVRVVRSVNKVSSFSANIYERVVDLHGLIEPENFSL